jgi:GPH family glycoside/pentoside/hexuronide:cation symporter
MRGVRRPVAATAASSPGGSSGRVERYAFAVGDFGLNLVWQGLGLFLIFFHTDVLGIPAAWAGACYLAASVWDGLTDPLVGALADRTRTRWGRYRPFLLLGALPLALSFALVFSAPALPLAGRVAWALGTQMLVRVLYNLVAIPYASLSAVITSDSDARTRLAGLRMQCAFLGGVAVAFLMPELAREFSGDREVPAYAGAALAIGLLGAAAFLACFLGVREAPLPDAPDAPRSSLRADAAAFLRALPHSAPLLRLILGKVLIVFALTLHTRNTIYFFKYVLDDVDAVRYAMPLLTAASFLSVPAWVWFIRRSSKRAAWRGACLATAGFALCLQLPLAHDLVWAIALLAAVAASTTAFAVCFWAMLPDTVEYHEWRCGRRDEAKIFGVASFLQKIAMGLSAMAGGLILEGSGFTANQAQPALALDAISATMGFAPACGALLSWYVMGRYSLDAKSHRELLAALARRLPPAPGSPAP